MGRRVDAVVEAASALMDSALRESKDHGYCMWCHQEDHWDDCLLNALKLALDALRDCEAEQAIEKLDDEPAGRGSVRG